VALLILARSRRDTPLYDTASIRAPQRVPWDLNTFLALFSLVCIWAALFTLTWARWGDLTIDCGREMYAAAELARGRTLYSDVWYPYTSGGPYFNSILFRLFGFQLSVLYWAGALAALGSAVLLFMTGLRFVSRFAAWTAGAVLLIQSFVSGIFSFPLPYSFGAVYGCLGACLCLWLIVNACSSLRAGWILAAGVVAAMTLLVKQEIGAACFAALALLVVIRGMQQLSFRRVAIDVAALLPGCLLCIAVIYWMISLRGAEFLTQENLMSWPTSYFMKRYGAVWLTKTGSAISWRGLFTGVAGLSIAVVFWLVVRWILVRYGRRRWLFWASLLALTALLVLGFRWGSLGQASRWVFFPPGAPFLVAVMIPAAAWLCWRNRFATGFVQILMLFSLTVCISFRILFGLYALRYPIYYDGPVLLSYFLILSWLFSSKAPGLTSSDRSAALLPYLATLVTATVLVLPLYKLDLSQAPLYTERGVIYTTPQKAGAYRSVLDFMQHEQPGASFLSVPEDMSLYFLTGIDCPIRVYQFAPGVLAPGKMTAELIQEIERKKVRYLIWSNRTFEEYGVPRFGVDFDPALGAYFRASYRPIRAIGDDADRGWKAVIWERISNPQPRGRPASTAASTLP
jgi:hypothetical protein